MHACILANISAFPTSKVIICQIKLCKLCKEEVDGELSDVNICMYVGVLLHLGTWCADM